MDGSLAPPASRVAAGRVRAKEEEEVVVVVVVVGAIVVVARGVDVGERHRFTQIGAVTAVVAVVQDVDEEEDEEEAVTVTVASAVSLRRRCATRPRRRLRRNRPTRAWPLVWAATTSGWCAKPFAPRG